MIFDMATCGVVTCLSIMLLSQALPIDWVAVIVAQLAALAYLAGRLRDSK